MTGGQRPLRELAAEHDGLLSTAGAAAAGWTADGLKRELRRGGWRSVRRGVWVERGRVVDFGLRLRAEQLGGPDLVVSHSAAAVVHGIEVLSARPEFTNARSRQRPAGAGVLHRIPLAEGEVTRVAGLRVTTVVRTLADLLMTASRDECLVAVESALTRRPVSGGAGGLGGTAAQRTARGRPGRPGHQGHPGHRGRLIDVQDLAEALRMYGHRRGFQRTGERMGLIDPLAGSPAETVARLRMWDAGLRPRSQVSFSEPHGRRMRVDFFFPVAGLVVEIEGYAFHGSRAAHENDVERFNALVRCPTVRRVLRFTAREVFQRPDRMVRAVRGALRELA